MMMARSSESSLTMELTVEYKIGLAQPDTPNRYQAKNLFVSQKSVKDKRSSADRTSHFRGFGMFQIIMQMVENRTQVVSML